MAIKYLIGIDEAGRGPIAGPVAVGAVAISVGRFPNHDLNQYLNHDLPLRDSKKLSERQREAWWEWLAGEEKQEKLWAASALVGPQVIDQEGVVAAIRQGINLCLKRLVIKGISPDQCQVLLDGGLWAPANFSNQQTIIRGDESEPVISLASIVAKVRRDQHMVKLAKIYPAYNFQQHKGYGTVAHYAALQQHGPCGLHRRSFLPGR